MNDHAEEDREIPGLKRIVSSLPVDHSGTFVYLRGWRSEGSSWPPLIFVHDLGEQADHYAAAAEAFVQKGYTSYAFDLRGHGRSGKLLGHLSRFDLLIKDLLQVAAWVKHREQGVAPIVIGQGIGALITAEFAARFQNFCGGMVLSAPCFHLQKPPSVFLKTLIKLASEIWPTWRPPRALTPNFSELLASPLRLTSASISTLLQAIKKSESTLGLCPTNTLVLCPEVDSISSYHPIKKNIAVHPHQRLKTVDLGGVPRNIFTSNNVGRAAAIEEISSWLMPFSIQDLESPLNTKVKMPESLEIPQDANHQIIDNASQEASSLKD